MKAYEVFARMAPEGATRLLVALQSQAPAVYTQAVAAASSVFKARPRFMMKQPQDKRAQMVRRALSRVAASPLAEEVLAAYFLEVRRPLLVEWLDRVGVEHEDGTLKSDVPPCPERPALEKAVASFRKDEDAGDRELLLQAFAAQSAVEWPALEELLKR